LEVGGSYPEALNWFVEMNFLHFALFLFVISSIILVAVSLAVPTAESYDDETLVWSKENVVPMSSSTRVLTFLLVLCVIALWVIF